MKASSPIWHNPYVRSEFLVLIVLLLLFGIFFLKAPVFIMIGFSLSAALFISMLGYRFNIDKIGFVVLVNYSYWLGSGFLVGALTPLDLLSAEFYNGEGRIFLSYIPLLFFSVICCQTKDLKIVIKSIVWLGVCSLFLYFLWILTHAPVLTKGKNFLGLMTSHTGAGTYFAMISSFLILYGYETHKKPFLLLGLMVFLPIFGSASREGLIASFTVFLWYVLKYFKLKRFIYFVMVLFMLGATLMLTSQHAYEKTRRMFSWDLMVRMQRAFENSHWQPEDRSDREFEGSEWNILSRMLFWSYAIKRFKESPVIGVGFGRHNDHYLKLYGSPGLVYLALEGKKRLTVGSAHNSYLHILEESGVVGLTLLIWLWVPIYIRLTKAEKLFRVFPEIRAYYIASQGLVIFTLVAACFGHALAAPSITAPVLTVVSMGIAHQRKFIEDKWLRENQLTRIDEEIK